MLRNLYNVWHKTLTKSRWNYQSQDKQKKETIKIRAEVNENRKSIEEKINKTKKKWFIEKNNKFDKLLDKLRKKDTN